MKKGDYVIVKAGGAKTQLLQVDSVDEKTLLGTITKNSHIPELCKSIEVPVKGVILNLGKKPEPGKVYNQDLNKLHLGRKDVPQYGEFHFFYKPSKETYTSLITAAKIVFKNLKKHKLTRILSENIYWEIEPPLGQKYAGMYKRTANKDFVIHQISIRPEVMATSDFPYVIAHELGHLLHFHYLAENRELEAKWIDLYNKSVRRVSVSKTTAEDILTILMDGEVRPSRLRSELDDDQRAAYQLITKSIRTSHKLSPRDLDVIFESGLKATIKDLWPKYIPAHEPQPILTDYAMTNYRELIAESFAFYLVGKKLPKSISKLVERSISYIKTQL